MNLVWLPILCGHVARSCHLHAREFLEVSDIHKAFINPELESITHTDYQIGKNSLFLPVTTPVVVSKCVTLTVAVGVKECATLPEPRTFSLLRDPIDFPTPLKSGIFRISTDGHPAVRGIGFPRRGSSGVLYLLWSSGHDSVS